MVIAILISLFLASCLAALLYELILKHIKTVSFEEHFNNVGIPLVKGKFGRNEYWFLIDTGSCLSHIDKSILDVVEYNTKKHNNISFVSAGGESIDCDYSIETTLYLNHIGHLFEFVPLDLQCATIQAEGFEDIVLGGVLGSDFLATYHYSIDYTNKKLVLA